MDRNDHKGLIAMLVEAEGNVPHMYLDTRGLVTVGIGHMIAVREDAARLPFLYVDRAPASPARIMSEYDWIKAQKPGRVASYYEQFASLHLTAEDIAALLDRDIADKERGVGVQFAGYPSYPHGPQDALLDMCFNLGEGGLLKYVKLHAAAQRRDWRACAEECHRNGVPEARNAATRALFQNAAETA